MRCDRCRALYKKNDWHECNGNDSTIPVPYVVIGTQHFSLCKNCMRILIKDFLKIPKGYICKEGW